MKKIEITSNNYNPNIRILKSHFVTFNEEFIYLYNMEGNLIDSITKKEIIDICIINNNYLIGFNNKYDIFGIIIKEEHLEIKDIFKENDGNMSFIYILDILYSNKNKSLIISYDDHIEIRDINSLKEKLIQIIFKDSSFLLNMNKDFFITFNKESISLYQKIIG